MVELEMDNLERVSCNFAHGAIDGTTVRASSAFPALGSDLFAYACPLQIIEGWFPQGSKVLSTRVFL
jgi:fructose 1,6-bisphosphatase